MILCVSILSMTSLASAATGDIVATGPLTIAGTAEISAPGAGAYVSNLTAFGGARGTASILVVREFVAHTIGVGTADVHLRNESRVSRFTDAVFEVRGSDGSWLGVYPDSVQTGWLASGGSTIILARAGSVLGESLPAESSPEPDRIGFGAALPGSMMEVTRAAAIRIDGDTTWKLFGASLHISSAETETAFTSGKSERDTQREYTVLFMTSENQALEITAPQGAVVAADTVSVSMDGLLSGRFEHGQVNDDGRILTAQGGMATIEGDLRIDARAAHDTNGIAIALEGDLRTSTLFSGAQVPAPAYRTTPFMALMLVGVVTAASIVLLRRRGRDSRLSALTVDDLLDLSNRAAEDKDFEAALRWNLRTQALSATSARLLCDEGFYRTELGDVDGALRAYEAAARAGRSGEAEFLAGRLLASLGRLDEAAGKVAHAITLEPSFAFAVEEDIILSIVRHDPAVQKAIHDAERDAHRT